MKHNIDHLLERYWEGETSVEDENLLKAYFNGENIDSAHAPYQDLFSWMNVSANVVCPVSCDINELLEKYWEGETTIKEENVLKSYFKSGQVAENHQPFTEMFAFFDLQSQITYSESEGREKQLDGKTDTKVIQLQIRRWLSIVAAALVLVIGAVFVVNNLKQETHTQQFANINEIEDPEEALRVTKEALALVSKKFRKSQESVRQNMGALEKASIFK